MRRLAYHLLWSLGLALLLAMSGKRASALTIQSSQAVTSNFSQVAFCSGNGTTAGSYACAETIYGVTEKRIVCTLTGYENTGATAQTCGFPAGFATVAAIVDNVIAEMWPATLTGVSTINLPTNMQTTVSGSIVIEGQ